jgi:hypothetical protein
MKKLLLTMVLFMAFTIAADAQTKITEKALMGVWQLKFNVTEDDIKEAAEDEENLLAKALIKGVAGFVGGILDEIDIKFEFQPKNKVQVMVNAFDETNDDEYTTWEITKDGYLIIGNTENFQTDEDSKWKLEDGILVEVETNKNSDNGKKVFMVKLN